MPQAYALLGLLFNEPPFDERAVASRSKRPNADTNQQCRSLAVGLDV
jgi:hypothetical protein